MTPLDKDGAKAGPSMATTNAAGEAGEETAFRFAPLVFDYAGYQEAEYHDQQGNALFYYLVEEEAPDGGMRDSVIYSTAKFLVVVTLKLENHELTAETAYYAYHGQIPESLQPAPEPVKS